MMATVSGGEVVKVEWGTRLVWPDGSVKVYPAPDREYAEQQVRNYNGVGLGWMSAVCRQVARGGWFEPSRR